MTARDAFLKRVRQAVADGNRPGAGATPGPRGTVGYQGAAGDPVGRFRAELTAAGGFPHVVPDRPAAVAQVLELVQSKAIRRVLLGTGRPLDSLNLAEPLRSRGI